MRVVQVTQATPIVVRAPAGGTSSAFEFTWTLPGVAETGQGVVPWYTNKRRKVSDLHMGCRPGKEPVGGPCIANLRLNGVSVFTDPDDRPRLPAGQHFADCAVPADLWMEPGDYLTWDMDEVGPLEPGEELTLTVQFA